MAANSWLEADSIVEYREDDNATCPYTWILARVKQHLPAAGYAVIETEDTTTAFPVPGAREYDPDSVKAAGVAKEVLEYCDEQLKLVNSHRKEASSSIYEDLECLPGICLRPPPPDTTVWDAREPPTDCRAGTYMEALVEGTPNSWIGVMVVMDGATGKLTLLDLNGDQLDHAKLSSIRRFRQPLVWKGPPREEVEECLCWAARLPPLSEEDELLKAVKEGQGPFWTEEELRDAELPEIPMIELVSKDNKYNESLIIGDYERLPWAILELCKAGHPGRTLLVHKRSKFIFRGKQGPTHWDCDRSGVDPIWTPKASNINIPKKKKQQAAPAEGGFEPQSKTEKQKEALKDDEVLWYEDPADHHLPPEVLVVRLPEGRSSRIWYIHPDGRKTRTKDAAQKWGQKEAGAAAGSKKESGHKGAAAQTSLGGTQARLRTRKRPGGGRGGDEDDKGDSGQPKQKNARTSTTGVKTSPKQHDKGKGRKGATAETSQDKQVEEHVEQQQPQQQPDSSMEDTPEASLLAGAPERAGGAGNHEDGAKESLGTCQLCGYEVRGSEEDMGQCRECKQEGHWGEGRCIKGRCIEHKVPPWRPKDCPEVCEFCSEAVEHQDKLAACLACGTVGHWFSCVKGYCRECQKKFKKPAACMAVAAQGHSSMVQPRTPAKPLAEEGGGGAGDYAEEVRRLKGLGVSVSFIGNTASKWRCTISETTLKLHGFNIGEKDSQGNKILLPKPQTAAQNLGQSLAGLHSALYKYLKGATQPGLLGICQTQKSRDYILQLVAQMEEEPREEIRRQLDPQAEQAVAAATGGGAAT